MLAITLKHDGFILIGDVVIALARGGDSARLAIAAPDGTPIHRLNAFGHCVNLSRRIITRYIERGQETAVLSCGHQIEATPIPPEADRAECPNCAAHCANAAALIQQHFGSIASVPDPAPPAPPAPGVNRELAAFEQATGIYSPI